MRPVTFEDPPHSYWRLPISAASSCHLNHRRTIGFFKTALQSIGYEDRQIAEKYSFVDFEDQRAVVQHVAVAAFSGYPYTYRNSCLGVAFNMDGRDGAALAHRHRALGAPLIFEVREEAIQAWSVGPDQALPDGKPFDLAALGSKFHSRRNVWNPSALGRLKTAADAKPNPQLDFYDTGLLPVLQAFFQEKLKDLLERAFVETATAYHQVHGSDPDVAYLFPYLFRFVTAKIFMDRADAQGWDGLVDPRAILDKAEEHSGSGLLEKLPSAFLNRKVLEKAWTSISGTLHFQNLSVPDLVGIYEDLFIDAGTRKKLGIHSTPVGLASYIVDHLPWERLPIDQRVVLEGFCGHGIFLAQAMERLGRDLDPKLNARQRHKYFQEMLIGVEKDPLAIEVCRLLLTLSDYPNDNSWQLHHSDVFTWREWDVALKSAAVVLANPPYESFTPEERKLVGATKAQPPGEFIHRMMRQPPAMLGLVLPQSFLSSPSYQDANRQIAGNYAEVSVIELPPIFKYADNETVALLASGRQEHGKSVSIQYSEVQPGRLREFFDDSAMSSRRTANVALGGKQHDFTLWIPPSGLTFTAFDALPTLGSVASIGKGLDWIKRTDGKTRVHPRTDVASDSPKPGFLRGAEKMAGNLSQLQIRQFRYLSLLPEHHNPRDKSWRRPWQRWKVVCNAARFERKSPWRLAAWADMQGLAFTKHYFALWPRDGISVHALAAVLSSPVANAFCFSHDLDRHNHKGTLTDLPIPSVDLLNDTGEIHTIAKEVQDRLEFWSEGVKANSDRLLELIIRLDASILEAYGLPANLQRQLLLQFEGWRRPFAVPFVRYFPEAFKDAVTLTDFVAIQYDWEKTNEERCDLIEKGLSEGGLTTLERNKLDHLQHLADLVIRLKQPYPVTELESLVAELKVVRK